MNPQDAGHACLDIGHTIIHYLALGAWIAGLVVAIVYRRVSKSMILVVVGFAGEIGVWLLPTLVSGMYRLTTFNPDVMLVLNFFNLFIELLGPVSTGLIVWGLYMVFQDFSTRKGRGGDRPSRRRRDEDDDF